MRHLNRASSDPLIFALEDRPPPLRSILAAVAHLAAIVASIMAAPLLLAGVIGLDEAVNALRGECLTFHLRHRDFCAGLSLWVGRIGVIICPRH